MEKKTFAQSLKEKSWLISLVLMLLVFLQTCSNSRNYKSVKKELDLQSKKIENLATKQELKIEGLEISKRMLYDNNAIIRTTVRPDDRMNQYDQEIKKIQAQNGQ
jgi:hypothetical protein